MKFHVGRKQELGKEQVKKRDSKEKIVGKKKTFFLLPTVHSLFKRICVVHWEDPEGSGGEGGGRGDWDGEHM